MDTIFIDTSVVIAYKYFHEKSLITVLGNLAKEGRLRIIIPEITAEEIKYNFENDFKDSYTAISKHFTMYSHCTTSFSMLKYDDSYKKAMEKVEDFFRLPNVKILPYDKTCDISPVFQKYFKKDPPFHSKNKKSEFPDAFVLDALEKYAAKYKTKIICFSHDGDFKLYDSKFFEKADLRTYINQKQKETECLESLEKALTVHKDSLLNDAKQMVNEYLDNERLYSHYGEIEINDVNVLDVQLSMKIDEYTVLSDIQEEMQISVPVELDFSIDISYNNYDMAFYDKEDGEWYGVEEDEYTLNNSTLIYLNLQFNKRLFPDQAEISLGDIDFSEVDEILNYK